MSGNPKKSLYYRGSFFGENSIYILTIVSNNVIIGVE